MPLGDDDKKQNTNQPSAEDKGSKKSTSSDQPPIGITVSHKHNLGVTSVTSGSQVNDGGTPNANLITTDSRRNKNNFSETFVGLKIGLESNLGRGSDLTISGQIGLEHANFTSTPTSPTTIIERKANSYDPGHDITLTGKDRITFTGVAVKGDYRVSLSSDDNPKVPQVKGNLDLGWGVVNVKTQDKGPIEGVDIAKFGAKIGLGAGISETSVTPGLMLHAGGRTTVGFNPDKPSASINTLGVTLDKTFHIGKAEVAVEASLLSVKGKTDNGKGKTDYSGQFTPSIGIGINIPIGGGRGGRDD